MRPSSCIISRWILAYQKSLTIHLHVAEYPQTWILLIHIQSLFPSCTWCPRNCLLCSLLPLDHHLLQLIPTLSSRTPLPPWWQHLNRGQSGNWGPNCPPKYLHQVPVLVRRWLCSHQKGNLSLPLLQLNSIFEVLKDVANELLHGRFIYSFIKTLNCLILSLINLSASNDVSMQFQGHLGERNSRVP